MGRKKPTARGDDENASAAVSKSKKKSQLIDDDEYSIGAELAEEPEAQEDKVVITGKKKGKKGNAKAPQRKDDDDGDGGEIENEEEEVPEVVFGGKKKGKSKKGGGNNAFGFGLLGEEEEEGGDDEDGQSGLTGKKDSEEDDEEQTVSFSGKKKKKNDSKKSGGSLFTASAFEAIDDDDEEEAEVLDKVEDDDDEPVIAFTGKKKKSTKGGDKGSVFTGSAFDGLGDDGDEDEDVAPITFSGKKKSSKSSKTLKKAGGNAFSAVLSDDKNGEEAVEDEDVSVVAFSGKKKSSKKKGISVFSALGDGDEVRDVVETEKLSVGTSSKSEEAKDTSKNKKKKKKSGRTAEEEDDLDKILAELGEGPTVSKPAALPPQEEKLELQPESISVVEEEVEEENVESAAAKKKKKKKEKEKEKKAAAAAAAAAVEEKQNEVQPEPTDGKKNEGKSKGMDKKLPKHVREMQEALARRKEAEERKKREDEERLRKEEEERCRLEELERQAEEAKRKKKEKEKEKLQRKKAEGKILTTKQREEARRLEAMRNQILANAGVPLPSGDTVVQTKRPKYQNKKQKPIHQQTNGAAPDKGEEEPQETLTNMDSLDSEKVDEESMGVEEEIVVAEAAEENGLEEDDDEDEWDAKSWDDVAVNLSIKSAFADEEADSEPERVVKRETKGAVPTSRNAAPPATAKKTIPSQPITSQNLENKRKDADLKKEVLVSEATSKQSEDNLRSPICCIMGHVDTGKTKLLDCIRGTNVQEGEAGGITQQIGATYFPAENIRERTKELKADAKLKVPGLLVIDTPGHESFTNLRSRGSGLCDIAILVVDIMHGLEPQTIESLNLLKMRNTEFIVALNKVDRLYGWKVCRNAPIVKAMKQQSKDLQNEFNMRLTQIITQFKEQGLNTELYYKNKEMGETFSIVPTSAISGEGIPDLLLLLVQWTQKTMVEKLTYSSEMQCTVLEVKVVEGHGTTIDVVLVNGVLHEGDQIVGPIVTSIRALLTPHPMKELRVKGTYLHHKKIKAAMGIKITAQGLEHAIAGTGLYVVGPDDDIEDVKDAAMEDMKTVMSRIDKSGEGVYVGTPICVPQQGFIDIGRIASIENNHKPVDIAKKGQKVAIKIVGSNSEEQQKMFGRHFEVEDELVSHISRKSIDVLKANYRDDLSIEEWKLVAKLKTLFKIQ
ncbi:hypothetical protein FH972_010518 [Carpinus fangiana]|uniref:Tr-type G domain-containing protein n=1 Tax=Carpinus fangiana TaxID=176857 RepID=A0A660KUM0_9ROSI|nr:hypothetical protein FH972_010518 [Carpinus fangiana]KAE8037970.1 hypothetical protein FH972_010518 [Carpinus fangiana]